MKKVFILLVIVILISLISCTKNPFPNASEVESKTNLVLETLANNNIIEGMDSLLSAIILTLQDADISDEAASLIRKGHDLFKDKEEGLNFPNPEAAKALWEAYKILKPVQQDLSIPSTMAPIAEAFNAKIKEAQEFIRQGSANKTLEALLEAFMITTPISE